MAMNGTDHRWELKGGARGESSSPSIPTGYALFQCQDCGMAAARQLTARNSGSLNSIIPHPEIEDNCTVDTETAQDGDSA